MRHNPPFSEETFVSSPPTSQETVYFKIHVSTNEYYTESKL
jgi:hypothetical protein